MADSHLNAPPLPVTGEARAYLNDQPDLGPMHAAAHRAELADALSGLTDSYGSPLAVDDPLAPLARDIRSGVSTC